MAIEIEKKYRLTEAEYHATIAALREIEAEYVGEEFEENTLYSNSKMEREKSVLRIRKTANRAILTFKRRIESEMDVKKQIEYETAISDSEAAKNIIESLGLQAAVVYEKRRKTWKLRNAEVVLDELPFGLFMEIEGEMTDIAQAEMILEAENFTVEYETYPRLTQKFGEQNGQIIEARFANFS